MTHKEFIQKVQMKKDERVNAGLISEHYPDVSEITVEMTYFRKNGIPVLMKRMVNLSPSSHAYFNMSCMVRRGYDYGFDLTSVITDQIRQQKKRVRGKMKFPEQEEDSVPYLDSIAYEIRVRYKGSIKAVTKLQ